MRVILILLIFAFCFKATAQTNEMEAKAAYQLAEESYGKGDMKATLEYLHDASEKLGAANPKILYLQIMAQRELANKDRSFLPKLDSTITLFQKSADIASFNEDKILEVTKIKLQLKKEMVQNRANDEALLKSRAGSGINGVERDYPDWPLGASLATLRSKHPDVFQANNFKTISYPKYTTYVILNSGLGIFSFEVHGDQLGRFTIALFKDDDDKGNIKGRKALTDYLEDLKNRIGYVPTPAMWDTSSTGVHTEVYQWKEGNKKLFVLVNFSSEGKSSYSVIIEDSSFIKN